MSFRGESSASCERTRNLDKIPGFRQPAKKAGMPCPGMTLPYNDRLTAIGVMLRGPGWLRWP